MSRGVEKKPRKVRSDKKHDIKPTVSVDLRDCIERMKQITGVSVMAIAEAICINGIGNKQVISHLSQYFRRTVRIDNSLYIGDTSNTSASTLKASGKTGRISIRFTAQTYEAISVLAWSMACTVSRACALLLDASVRDSEFIDSFVRRYLEENIDDERMRELRKVLNYVNAGNPYNEEYSWTALLSFMVDEVREASEKVSDTVTGFIVKHWRDK